MRRTKSILAVAVTMVMMLAVSAGPAMAVDNDHHVNSVDDRIDNQLDRLDNPLLVGDLFNDGAILDNALISDFDHGLVGDLDNIDSGFMVDNHHGHVGAIHL